LAFMLILGLTRCAMHIFFRSTHSNSKMCISVLLNQTPRNRLFGTLCRGHRENPLSDLPQSMSPQICRKACRPLFELDCGQRGAVALDGLIKSRGYRAILHSRQVACLHDTNAISASPTNSRLQEVGETKRTHVSGQGHQAANGPASLFFW
jgi:hypothetical protein